MSLDWIPISFKRSWTVLQGMITSNNLHTYRSFHSIGVVRHVCISLESGLFEKGKFRLTSSHSSDPSEPCTDELVTAPPFERWERAAVAAAFPGAALCGCMGLGGALNFCRTSAHFSVTHNLMEYDPQCIPRTMAGGTWKSRLGPTQPHMADYYGIVIHRSSL